MSVLVRSMIITQLYRQTAASFLPTCIQGGGSWQEREREWDSSSAFKSSDFQIAPPPPPQRTREDKRGASVVAQCQMIHPHLL